jgi:two-component system OmpR family sensor kinase
VSLRLRILVAVVALTAVGLGFASVGTYFALRSFLVDRIDEQLAVSVGPVSEELGSPLRFGETRPARAFLPAGTVYLLREADGTTLQGPQSVSLAATRDAEMLLPDLPERIALSGNDERFFTVGGIGEAPTFRVLAVSSPSGQTQLVIAIPLDDVETTLGRLIAIELVVTASVLGAVAMIGSVVVARGFRPLRRITATAVEIARSGDLTRRVDLPSGTTGEVLQLGTAFNTMVERIEGAFTATEQALSEKEASEARLRRFVADASHELRTPLAAIRAHAELFRRGVAARPDDLARVMRRIEDESARMGGLVEDLLLLARLDQGRPLACDPVDLGLIAADVTTDARVMSPRRSFRLRLPDTPVVVPGDEARLRQVALNLVANAVAHTPEGSHVEVRVRVEGPSAVLEVADDGPGLDLEDARRVFERFFRADGSRSRETGGSGLGLSIVDAIARAHGGRASVGPTPGGGATFRVELPLVAPGRAVATPAPVPPVPPPPPPPVTAPPVTAPPAAGWPAPVRRSRPDIG